MSIAFDEYVKFQQISGHQGLFAYQSGFMKCNEFWFNLSEREFRDAIAI